MENTKELEELTNYRKSPVCLGVYTIETNSFGMGNNKIYEIPKRAKYRRIRIRHGNPKLMFFDKKPQGSKNRYESITDGDYTHISFPDFFMKTTKIVPGNPKHYKLN